MIIKPILKKTAILGAASLLVVASCGKKKSSSSASSTDGSVEPNEDTVVTLETGALQLAGEVTILKGKDAGASLAMKEVSFKLADSRTVRLRMTNEAFQEIERAGEIMCFLSQTKFWEQANAGIYQAQVDETKCSREQKGGGDSGGQQGGDSSSANQSPSLVTVYVNATREENKPLIAEMRLMEADDAQYHVKVIVVEPPSDEAPAGVFEMRYTGHVAGQIAGNGFIRTKRTAGGAKFILETGSNESKDDRSSQGQGIAELEVLDEETIIGYIHSSSKNSEGTTYSQSAVGQARFDANYLNVDYKVAFSHPGGSGEEALLGCYDLNKYKTAIYRYDLVDASGATVALNSGFPVELSKNGKVQHGWAGYHGLWLGDSASVATGDTVNKVEWTNGQKASTPYTVFAAPGKLTKLTKATVTLGTLKGVDINFYDNGSNYIVKWDGSTLTKTAKVTYGNNGPEEEAATGTVEIPQWGANLWIPSLNANIQISPSMTLSDSLSLSYHSQKIVSGTSEVPTCSLVCFSNCPEMTPAAADFERSQSGQMGPMSSNLYKTTTVTWGQTSYTTNQAQNITSPLATYTWDATAQNLKNGSTAFTLPSGLSTDQESSMQMQNVYSGALVCSDVYSAIADKTIDPWRLTNQLDTYYMFNAGPMAWNQFIALKGSNGQFVTFDAPLELSYTHTTAND
ncbi:MAG: hypothetical protein M3Q07_25690, partial [Pseudobdellovibrionaceae bacterium]|nr:hypothetical protein [Pseudobdellovibrionaceae bacterium]